MRRREVEAEVRDDPALHPGQGRLDVEEARQRAGRVEGLAAHAAHEIAHHVPAGRDHGVAHDPIRPGFEPGAILSEVPT